MIAGRIRRPFPTGIPKLVLPVLAFGACESRDESVGSRITDMQRPAVASERAPVPSSQYPRLLLEAGVRGETLVAFHADSAGTPTPGTLMVTRISHAGFCSAVRGAVFNGEYRASERSEGGWLVANVTCSAGTCVSGDAKAYRGPTLPRLHCG